jgi:hypothetical protein
VVDRFYELIDGPQAATADAFVGDLFEPALD